MKLSAALSLGALTLALAACSTTPTNTTNTAATPSVQASATTPTVVTSNDVDTVMNAFLVRTVDGAEVLEPVTAQTQIKKGDLVEYQVLLTNNGKDRVRDMRVALSLPAGAEFTGFVSPSIGTQASADGSRFVFMPIRSSVNGTTQNLPFAQYQALRWSIQDLGIGATTVVKYRAIIR
ncbi:DUF11 domain-containing protein [Moraxella sp. RCAD0137]|uniref:DUF11 domain-containing protein n=1 Tax=Moraxella sp. RCAD0137 TaxID=1775913 RepID=UPI001D0D0F73|nr:DUF11 domain-containing protein [Moraxella sp. RCAD0137]